MHEKLIGLIEALPDGEGSNELDALCEVALFRPSSLYGAISLNSAGSKVVYHNGGKHHVFWPMDWTSATARASTIRRLKEEK